MKNTIRRNSLDRNKSIILDSLSFETSSSISLEHSENPWKILIWVNSMRLNSSKSCESRPRPIPCQRLHPCFSEHLWCGGLSCSEGGRCCNGSTGRRSGCSPKVSPQCGPANICRCKVTGQWQNPCVLTCFCISVSILHFRISSNCLRTLQFCKKRK